MSQLSGVPEHVLDLIRSAPTGEFATVSRAGVPIDTPMLLFPKEDLSTIDVGTGVAYPAKADRARRNPKVGLLFEGEPGSPVVSVAGMAAVRDRDVQGNVERYIAETAWDGLFTSVPWEEAREAVWYWSRIIVEIAPRRILWWESAEAMDEPPQRWEAPDGTTFPQSDPAPSASPAKAPAWDKPEWRGLASDMLAQGMPAHVTLFDAEGFPLPFRVSDVRVTDQGLAFRAPLGPPWRKEGVATLTFIGTATFVGTIAGEGHEMELTVQRPLPRLPLMADNRQVFNPEEDTRSRLLERLQRELTRRGDQSVPHIPETKPAPTPGAVRRYHLA
jgi:hypothetical protein